jgi:hypothetical protein
VPTSGSLQYQRDWRATLRDLAGAIGRLLFVTRTPVTRAGAGFAYLQRSASYGTSYPGRVIAAEELLAAALPDFCSRGATDPPRFAFTLRGSYI